MKYKNAAEILPDTLLKELQKYVSGEAIYVPSGTGRRKWGDQNGTRKFYQQRNEEICDRYLQGASIDELAEQYGLSPDTIRKIVYK